MILYQLCVLFAGVSVIAAVAGFIHTDDLPLGSRFRILLLLLFFWWVVLPYSIIKEVRGC
jgi:hypothetical protein